MKLSIDDLGPVYEDVYKVRPPWYELGLQLRVPPDTLDSIKSERLDPGESLRKALTVWLKGVDPWPTWSSMIEALRSSTVGEFQLANHLERKYCDVGHTEEPQSQARKSTSRKQPTCSMLPVSPLIATVVILLSIFIYIIFHQNSQQSSVPMVESHPSVHIYNELEVPSLQNHSDSLVPNNLPVLSGPFLGRDNDLKNISHLLIYPAYSDITMVNICGAPAVGKSTLAIHIGHTLAAQGIAIRYIPVQDAHSLLSTFYESSPQNHTVKKESKADAGKSSKLSVSYSDIVLPLYAQSEQHYVPASAQHLLEWAMGLKNDTLLILDNCDHLLQSERHEDTFKQALKDLHEASKYLRIIVTSRMQFTILDGFRNWKLSSLDNSSAIELLQHESKSLFTARESREIAELVGNNPLALKIAADLVRENKILTSQMIIHELKNNPIEILSPPTNVKSEKMLPILQLSYKYLNPITKACAHNLSHFPGSFSTDAEVNILSMLNFSHPMSCMENLSSRSLLEVYQHAGVHRCQFHTLIKEFLDYVQQINHADIYAQTAEQFRWSYQVYYSQVLANSSQLYIENAEKVHIITVLENDIHNIRELFEMLRKEQLTDDSTIRVGHSLCSDLLSEVFPKIELLKPLMKVISLMVRKLIIHMSEVSGINDGIHLYFKLFSQAKLYLTAIDSRSLCYTMCLDLFDKDKILYIQRIKEHFSVNEELLMKAEELSVHYDYPWACRHDCMINEQSLSFWLTPFTHAVKVIVVLIIGAEIWKSCFSGTRVMRAVTVSFGTVALACLVLNVIDYYCYPFVLNSVNPHSNHTIIVTGGLMIIILCIGYWDVRILFALLTILLLLSDALARKYFLVCVLFIAQNLFTSLRFCFILLLFLFPFGYILYLVP